MNIHDLSNGIEARYLLHFPVPIFLTNTWQGEQHGHFFVHENGCDAVFHVGEVYKKCGEKGHEKGLKKKKYENLIVRNMYESHAAGLMVFYTLVTTVFYTILSVCGTVDISQ